VSLPGEDQARTRADEEYRALHVLRELPVTTRASRWHANHQFNRAQSLLADLHSREAAEESSFAAETRIGYLEVPEPAPVLENFFPDGEVISRRRSPEMLADMRRRHAVAIAEHAERERVRVAELEHTKSVHARLLSTERARDLQEQAEMWPDEAILSPGVAEIHGIEDQVEAQNDAIERVVDALAGVLAQSIEALENTTINADPEPSTPPARAMEALTQTKFTFDYWPAARAAYTSESRQLVIECELPTTAVIPSVKTYRYVRNRERVTATTRSAAQIKALYSGVIAQLTLTFLARAFASDIEKAVDVVVFNGVVDTIDPRTGQPIRPCLITVRVTRETFDGLRLDNVDPMLCLKHLSASVSRSPTELAPVKPVLEFSMVDPRFVAATDAMSGLDERPNLMHLNPFEFEGLIQNLFTRMGLETRQTRPSRDGGVDCIAYDTRPILGGKIVIQAKRYKNTVGVSAVRDLYGTLQNEGASKGVLVTTSGYGQASFDFARNKPIELIDGANLLYLLETHVGMKARIEPPEDWRDPIPDTPILDTRVDTSKER
jgi:HJR/Mrr/RecB family endonuclease